jgi:beta-1,4-mannosyltransferase
MNAWYMPSFHRRLFLFCFVFRLDNYSVCGPFLSRLVPMPFDNVQNAHLRPAPWRFQKGSFMRKYNSTRRRTVISLGPINSTLNKYVDLFSKAISDQQYSICEFEWRPAVLRKSNVVILHWPNEFFAAEKKSATIKSIIKLAAIWLSKYLWRTRFIWVAHNAAPHDTETSAPRLTRWFLRSVDGIIFLSANSRNLITNLYPESRDRRSLVTVHGHYRDIAVTPLTPSPVPAGDVKLVCVGLVRPYKNLELLIDAAIRVSGIQLLVAGLSRDPSHRDALRARAAEAQHITLDLWDAPISESKFEAIVDSSDAIVLPYRTILNSGAALFALSRNRPILAPSIGSLPELRETVGTDWVYLYQGEFNQGVLVEFIAWMRKTKRSEQAPLDYHDWNRIGQDLGGFIESIRNASRPATASRQVA